MSISCVAKIFLNQYNTLNQNGVIGDSTECFSPKDVGTFYTHVHTFNDFLNVTECQARG